jgi:hypothetical protein
MRWSGRASEPGCLQVHAQLRAPFCPEDLDLLAPRHSDVVFRRYDLEGEAKLAHQLDVLGIIQDEYGAESATRGLCATDR